MSHGDRKLQPKAKRRHRTTIATILGTAVVALSLAVSGESPTHLYTVLAEEKGRETRNSDDPRQTEVPTPRAGQPQQTSATEDSTWTIWNTISAVVILVAVGPWIYKKFLKRLIGGPLTSAAKTIRWTIQAVVGTVKVLFTTTAALAMGLAFLYAMYFVVIYPGYAAIEGEPRAALDIAIWNLTHFPPSVGTEALCFSGDLDTPAALALKRKAHQIGRGLEVRHGVELTDGSNIAVVRGLGPHDGLAHQVIDGGRGCIKIALGANDHGDIIRHEWAHIAAGTSDWHGPKWRQMAAAFGADTEPYAHCSSRNEDCKPRY